MSAPVAVVDTNVLVSGLFRRSLTPRRLLEALRDNAFVLATSPSLLSELIDVISCPSIRRLVSAEALEVLGDALREDVLIVVPTERPEVVLTDPDDDELFACAIAANASWVVSGDKAVLGVRRFRTICVVSPSAFLNELTRSSQR